jgi:hypothetical protein
MATAPKTRKPAATTATSRSSSGAVAKSGSAAVTLKSGSKRRTWLPLGLFVLGSVMIAFVPAAYNAHDGGSSSSSSGYVEPTIPGLIYKDVFSAAKKVLPDADLSTNDYGSTHATYIDNGASTDALLSGRINIYTNDKGDSAPVTGVSCDVSSTTGADSPIIQFCTSLDYTGADPVATTAWMRDFFATPAKGSSLSQDRAGLSWQLGVQQYQPVIFEYSVDVTGPY